MRTPPLILIVDDNPTNLEVLQVRLRANGYDLITAVDGEDALAKVREFEPDLLLLDVMMPKLDGISVVKQLKQDSKLRFIPVILVTAKADTRDLVAGLDAGGDDYLTKPFEQAALMARVRSMLRIRNCTTRCRRRRRSCRSRPSSSRTGISCWSGPRRRPAGRNREHQPPAKIPGAAGSQDDRLFRHGGATGQSPARCNRCVLRPARLYLIHRQKLETGRGNGGARRLSREPGDAHLPV